MYKKIVLILLLFTIITSSCRSKKEVTCPSFDIEETNNEKIENKDKKGSKYSIIILKDGERINKSKRKKRESQKIDFLRKKCIKIKTGFNNRFCKLPLLKARTKDPLINSQML